jgi:ParB family chromosome partitioning protein
MGHARALLPLTKSEQGRIAALIADKGISVREAERLVARELNPAQAKSATPTVDRDVQRLQEELSDSLGADVKISANRKGAGTMTIRFASLDQLDGILGRIRSKTHE